MNLEKTKRNEYGLFDHVKYEFDENGFVNWRKLISQEFLVPNEQKLTDDQKKALESGTLKLEELNDNQMLILLGGIKELASLRGFVSVEYEVVSASREYCCVKCSINWMPNFETEGNYIIFSSVADAHAGSTDERIGVNYLATIAENRAFTRAVRNFLKINILGKEEIKATGFTKNFNEAAPKTSGTPKPKDILKSLMEEKNVSFSSIQNKMIKDGVEGADKLTGIDDLSIPTILQFITLIKNKKS